MSRSTARSSPVVVAAMALGRSSVLTRSHAVTSNAGSKCESRTIFQTASNVSPALYTSAAGAAAAAATSRAAVRNDFT
jgi:hypothetical protein